MLILTAVAGVGQARTALEYGEQPQVPASRVVDMRLGRIVISGLLPGGTAQAAYNAALGVQGGMAPYRFSIVAGVLPQGLSLNTTTGTISGVPQQAGTFIFRVAVRDRLIDIGEGTVTLAVKAGERAAITVAIAPDVVTMTTAGSQQFSATVRGTSQTGVTWWASAGSISSSGMFHAPSVTAATAITVTVTSTADPSKKASAALTISAPPVQQSLAITTTAIPAGTSGASYTANFNATGGQPPYQWSVPSGLLPAGLNLNGATGVLSGTATAPGQYPLTVKVTDGAAHAATQTFTLVVSAQQTNGKFDGPAELPRVYIQSALSNTPAPGTTIAVAAGGSLQAALNSAKCGDTISLQAGATFTGNYAFPAKGCDDQHWIIVRSSAPDTALPPEGTRLTPCYAGVSSLPGRPALNCQSTQNVTARLVFGAKSGDGPIVFASGANHYRLMGLEVTRQAGGLIVYHLISMTQGGTADHIILDRVWVHGTAQDETKSGIGTAGSTNLAIVDSTFTDLHCIALTGACTDGNAIGGGNGNSPMGPYKIVNNFLEAGGESIIFGGSQATQTPTDIEIRRNHLFKPLTWMKGQPGFVGGADGSPFVAKNNFELKNAQRVLFEANILENSWGGFTQNGFSILLTPRNQQAADGSNVCPRCQITDVTIRYNTISHAGAGMQITNGLTGPQGPLDGQRYSIHDIIIDDIDPVKYSGSGNLMQIGTGPAPSPILQNVTINHITGLTHNSFMMVGGRMVNATMRNFTYTNNLVTAGPYPIYSTGGAVNCANNKNPLGILNACFNPYVFAGNAIYSSGTQYGLSAFPGNNMLVANVASEFVNYNNGNGGDYHLSANSSCKSAATDGKDIGADVNTVMAAIAGVR